MFITYILYSEKSNRYYVGSTGNLEDRLKRHNTGRSTFTKRGIPWKIVYQKEYNSKSEAYQAELFIKSQKSRKFIEDIQKHKNTVSNRR
jgi:putative endonuclease